MRCKVCEVVGLDNPAFIVCRIPKIAKILKLDSEDIPLCRSCWNFFVEGDRILYNECYNCHYL